MSDQPAIPVTDAVETFVASLRQRAVPLNTIKSYAHDLRLFIQAVPADLAIVTSEQIQAFLTSDEHHSAATRRRRYSTLCQGVRQGGSCPSRPGHGMLLY
jgi:site-specific recombinase XerD